MINIPSEYTKTLGYQIYLANNIGEGHTWIAIFNNIHIDYRLDVKVLGQLDIKLYTKLSWEEGIGQRFFWFHDSGL